MAPVGCFRSCSGWLTAQLFGFRRERQYLLLLPSFSLISDLALCDNRVGVLCHQFAGGAGKEPERQKLQCQEQELTTGALSFVIPAMMRGQSRARIPSSHCQQQEISLPPGALPLLLMEFPIKGAGRGPCRLCVI